MIFKNNSFQKIFTLILAIFMLQACELANNQMSYDRSGEKTIQDYRKALSPNKDTFGEEKEFIPDMQSYISQENYNKTEYPLVSVSVNQTVSLRDLLFELADQVEIDLELDPQIRGSMIFTVRERPFDEVIDRIAEMAGLTYRFEDNLLRVELDRPYVKTYNMEYLNFTRSVTSKVELDVSVISGDETTVGSGSSIDTQMEADFWEDLDENLEQILTSSENYISLATLEDPVAQPRATMTEEQTALVSNPADIPAPILNITAPPRASEPQEPNAPSAFSINKQTGMISIFATERQHKLAEQYLETVKRSVSTQILIEAKILEVTLSDEFNTGINWNGDGGSLIDLTGLASLSGSFPATALSPPSGAGFSVALNPGSDISATVTALNRFGTVRALSSPRLTVLNNQSALLNVVENKVFFEFEATVNNDPDTGRTTSVDIDTEIRSVPLGVMLNVIPTIDFESGEITMMLRPTVSSLADEAVDPSLTLVLAGADPATVALLNLDDLRNFIPELSVQEIDSVVKVQSGEVIVMGGLMTDKNIVEDVGVPVLSSVPYFGRLFSNHKDSIRKTELVVFLKATIVPSSNVIDDKDKKLYKDFGLDRRPFKM